LCGKRQQGRDRHYENEIPELHLHLLFDTKCSIPSIGRERVSSGSTVDGIRKLLYIAE
jgi:hypothetical protein